MSVARVAIRELRSSPGRLGAVLAAIALGVGFLSASLTFLATERAAVAASTSVSLSTSDVVIDADGGALSSADLEQAAREVPGVADRAQVWQGGLTFRGPTGVGYLALDSLPTVESLRWQRLQEGAWPTTPDQLAVGRRTAEQHQLRVGSVIEVSTDGAQTDRSMTVTGLLDESRLLLAPTGDAGVVSDAFFEQLGTESASLPARYLLTVDPGADPATVAAALQTSLSTEGVTVTTSAELAEQILVGLTGGVDVFALLLQGFGTIALLVAGIMITNTFAILIAQRRRQLGLLRAVGATGSEVRGMVLAEAAAIGLTGALLGAAVGIGLALVGASVTGSILFGLVVPWAQLAAAIAVGIVITVVAAIMPAVRASRIRPMEALRDADPDPVRGRRNPVLIILAATLIVIGTAAMVVGLLQRTTVLLPVMAGAAVLAVGVIVAAPIYVTALARGLGMLLRRSGPVVRLAAANTVRHPGRSAATCAALMIAVGLVMTLQVGAASIKASADADAQTRFPVDVVVSAHDQPLPTGVIERIRQVNGLAATTTVRQVLAEVAGSQVIMTGLGPDADAVVRGGMERLDGDATALISPYTARTLGLTEGQTVPVDVEGRTQQLTLRVSRIAEDFALVIKEASLRQLAPGAPVAALWATASDRSQAQSITAEVRAAIDNQAGVEVGGSLAQAARLGELINALLAGALALLGVAVLIALIGVGNTLGLSVIERTRENALLRALGLDRGGLRAMLAVEAVLLALIGTAVGIVAGIGFGFLGTVALTREASFSAPVLVVSPTQTAVVIVVALLAGVVASILPGRRAALTPPVAAL